MGKEFNWIERYFRQPFSYQKNIPGILGIGDDAALIPASLKSDASHWAVSTDTLNEGVHFTTDMPPDTVAYKALAVNISDMAAMGSDPQYFFLALSLPAQKEGEMEAWLADFSGGLKQAAEQFQVVLMGGDTCRSVSGISVSITVMGKVAKDQALLRSGAQVGDHVYVSGELGWAALGLQVQQGQLKLPAPFQEQAIQALYAPKPQVALGRALLGIANSAIDISDGLMGDALHIADASDVGIEIELDKLPLPSKDIGLSEQALLQLALCGGEDYQLCFTVAEKNLPQLKLISEEHSLWCVGRCVEGSGVKWQEGRLENPKGLSSFQHF